MAELPVRIADAELRVLKVLWEHENLSAREITDALYSPTTGSEIGTVQTLLQRLERKGLVGRDRSHHVHRFRAKATRSEFAGRQLEAMVEKLTDGSLVPLLAHLVHAGGLSDDEKAELRRLLNQKSHPKRRGAR
jgi:BlaI family transcriptional regulator, penicillinase repressor